VDLSRSLAGLAAIIATWPHPGRFYDKECCCLGTFQVKLWSTLNLQGPHSLHSDPRATANKEFLRGWIPCQMVFHAEYLTQSCTLPSRRSHRTLVIGTETSITHHCLLIEYLQNLRKSRDFWY
jgi:hypothetical protein